jgi:hypothetical protein
MSSVCGVSWCGCSCSLGKCARRETECKSNLGSRVVYFALMVHANVVWCVKRSSGRSGEVGMMECLMWRAGAMCVARLRSLSTFLVDTAGRRLEHKCIVFSGIE